MTPAQHVVTVKLQRAYNEWRPQCSCGWVGSYWPTERRAADETAAHRASSD